MKRGNKKEDNKEYLLNDEDVLKIAGNGSIVMSYPELYKYNSIDELFNSGVTKILLLYLTDKDDKNMDYTGHWCALVKPRTYALRPTKYNHILFFDSYGLLPDSEIKFNKNVSKRRHLNQNHNYLTKLLYDFSKMGNVVEYNEYRFQAKGSNINTCGRWASFFALCSDNMTMTEFQHLFISLRKSIKPHTLDDLITSITNFIINK